MKIQATVKRSPTSRIPREVATRALLSPRISGKSRRLFTRARDRVVDVERQDPKNEQEVFCSKIKRLSLLQLGNHLDQAKRGVRRLTKALDASTLDNIRKTLQEALTVLQYRHHCK